MTHWGELRGWRGSSSEDMEPQGAVGYAKASCVENIPAKPERLRGETRYAERLINSKRTGFSGTEAGTGRRWEFCTIRCR